MSIWLLLPHIFVYRRKKNMVGALMHFFTTMILVSIVNLSIFTVSIQKMWVTSSSIKANIIIEWPKMIKFQKFQYFLNHVKVIADQSFCFLENIDDAVEKLFENWCFTHRGQLLIKMSYYFPMFTISRLYFLTQFLCRAIRRKTHPD